MTPEITHLWEKWLCNNKNEFQYNNKKLYLENIFINKQIFISTHSSVFINTFIDNSDFCCIYEFDSKSEKNSYISPNNQNQNVITINPLVSIARKVELSQHNILDNLGVKGADILQFNGVIWVEGPSDIIYIRKWLEMYASEMNLPILKQGMQYEFQMFAGTLLDSLYLANNNPSPENEYIKLVNMFSISRNAYVIMDSDAIKKENKIIDQSKFVEAKNFIAKKFKEFSSLGYKLGIWYEKFNTEIRSLEDYFQGSPNKPKKLYALEITNDWIKNKHLSDFKYNLKAKIGELDNLIRSWDI